MPLPRSRRGLQAWARLGIKFRFDEDLLDPLNAPELVAALEELKREFVAFAHNPDGLEKQFNDMVAELREEFCKKNPRLRVRYATVIKPENADA